MRILVTGSHGFIGSHLCNRLVSEGHEIDGWDVKDDRDAWEIKNRDIVSNGMVIHLAAHANVRESIENPELYFYNNIKLTKKLQQMCHEAKVPMIYASSSCVHNWYLSPYGTSKMVNEQTAFENQIGLRFTTVYGEGARESMLFEKIKSGTLSHITNHIRDFIHVDDVVEAIMLFVNTGFDKKKPVYDVGTGVGIRVDQLVNEMFKLNVPVQDGLPCEAINNTCDPRPLQELGWLPNPQIRL